jgi:hypothetical protein
MTAMLCVTVCGGRLRATTREQELYSHAKYSDQNYSNKEDCDWLIFVHQGDYRIRLTFRTFEVEDEIDCG